MTVYAIAWALLYTDPTSTSAQCAPCSMNITESQQITPDDAPLFQVANKPKYYEIKGDR